MCEFLLKRGKDKRMKMQSSVSLQNQKGSERECAFGRRKGPARWKRKINNKYKVLVGQMNTWKRDVSFTGFRTLGTFYLCAGFIGNSPVFCTLQHKWVEANRWAECRNYSKKQQAQFNGQALCLYGSLGCRENSHVCVQIRAQREAEALVELPSALSSPHLSTLFSGSDLSQPLSPSVSSKLGL